MTRLPDSTVVVCTRNRSRRLADACGEMLALDYPAERWELVIVDNRSTDDTLAVARELEASHPGRVRVVEEREVGLSAARNAGLRAARGEIVAFLDDDAFPPPGWLRALAAALGRRGALAAGGPVVPRFEGELPDWFRGRFLPYLSAWDRGEEAEVLTYNEYPRGTNMAFRREAFERFGEFSTHLGRKGGSLLSGEEVELCLRIERGGGLVLYVPEAGVRHAVAADRVTREWLVARFGAQGRTEAIIDWRHGGLRGLAAGCRLHGRNAVAGWRDRRRDGAIVAACSRGAFAGYLDGALRALVTVPRYRPADPGVRLAAWRPDRRNGRPRGR
jgi:glycosyltransferase involved in cell wall biosynthesis